MFYPTEQLRNPMGSHPAITLHKRWHRPSACAVTKLFAGDTKKAWQSVQKYILKQDDRGQTKNSVKKELAAVIHSFSP